MPPLTGKIGRVKFAAATVLTCPGAVRSKIEGAFKSTVRLNLGVVHAIASANRCPRIAAGMPTKPNARLKVLLRVSQRLTVIAQAEIHSQIGTDLPIVLHESAQQPLSEVVLIDSEINRL